MHGVVSARRLRRRLGGGKWNCLRVGSVWVWPRRTGVRGCGWREFGEHDGFDLPRERFEFSFDDRPDDVVVESIVAVDQAVSHADDLVPGDLGVTLLEGFRQPRGRFADKLNQALAGALEQEVGGEFRLGPARKESPRLGTEIEDLLEGFLWVMIAHRALTRSVARPPGGGG